MAIKFCAPIAMLVVVLIAGNLASVSAQMVNGMYKMGEAEGKELWLGLLEPRTAKLTWANADRHCKSRNMRLISAPFSQEVKDVLEPFFHPTGFSNGVNTPMFWNAGKNGNNCQFTNFRRVQNVAAEAVITHPFQTCSKVISSHGAGVVCEV